MRRIRYQPPNQVDPDQERLPLDTICTILTRQSTLMQAERNINSSELNPQDLMETALRMGFAQECIEVVNADTGISAYNTTIEDRPGLSTWLFRDLPSGRSLVVLVSMEDRLFRDRDEVEHNKFIAHVEKHGGWVICGQTVYNFRREFDRERFRMACKFGREFIEHFIKRRLHPAAHRAAMAGRYPGGPISMGYVVDYDPRSLTYKHFVRYAPHAELVTDHVFRVFAGLPFPSTVEVARHWAREGLVWPFFGPEVDARRVRPMDARHVRDEQHGGYLFHFRQARHILTNVVYLGWMVHRRRPATDAQGQPMICHEPLVDADLFWWCYDQLEEERPVWAPPRPSSLAISSYRPRVLRRRDPEAIPFLAPGRLRCAMHQTPVGAVTYPNGSILVRCHGNERFHLESASCSAITASVIDDALCRSFVEQLVLDDSDIRELARVAQRREVQHQTQPAHLQRQLAKQRTYLDRAKRMALQAEDERLAVEFLEEARTATRSICALEQEMADLATGIKPSSRAWTTAEHAAALAERIRATFTDWPRHAQLRVLLLALQEGVLGRVGRQAFGMWLRWYGGTESRVEISTKVAQFTSWSHGEREALRQYYPQLTWAALLAMFLGRTQPAIKREAGRLGLARPRGGPFCSTLPIVFPAPEGANLMASYGFVPGAGSLSQGSGTRAVSGAVSRQMTRSCSWTR